jgi:uncharacterized protein involved in propanediol utilization
MANATLTFKRQKISALVLANAGELVAGVIKDIAGNDISTSINGNKLTTDLIQSIAMQRMIKKIATN